MKPVSHDDHVSDGGEGIRHLVAVAVMVVFVVGTDIAIITHKVIVLELV